MNWNMQTWLIRKNNEAEDNNVSEDCWEYQQFISYTVSLPN